MASPEGVESAVESQDVPTTNDARALTADLSLTDDVKQEIRSIKLNSVCLYCCVILVVSTTTTLSNFAPSLLLDTELNTASSLSIALLEVLGSALLLPYLSIVVGSRKMVTVTLAVVYCYTLTYLYHSWFLTIPGSLMLGLGQGFMATLFMYSTSLGFHYCELVNCNRDVVISVMSGLIVSCSGGGLLLGSAVLYPILSPSSNNDNTTDCREFSCYEDVNDVNFRMSFEEWRYYAMVEIFATLAISGILFSLFLRDFSKESQRIVSGYLVITKDTWLLLMDYRIYFLIVVTIFIGYEEAFFFSGAIQNSLSCTIGMPKVWLVMTMSYSAAQIVACATQWIWVKYFGRTSITGIGILAFMSCLLTTILWHPTLVKIEVLIVISAVWGIAHGVLVSSVFSLFAVQSRKSTEASFTWAYFCRSLGHLISFLGVQYLCIYVNLSILIVIGLTGFLLYCSLEYKIKQEFLNQPSA